MRNGEGFLLVFSVIDRSRFVNAEFFLVSLSLTTTLYWCASFIILFKSCLSTFPNTNKRVKLDTYTVAE